MKRSILLIYYALIGFFYYINTANAASTTGKVSMQDFWMVKGEQQTVGLHVTNATTYTAFQCDLFLPTGITLGQNAQGLPLVTLNGANTKTHLTESSYLSNGGIRIVVMSMSNKTFSSNSDAIANIIIQASSETVGQQTIRIENVRLVTAGTRIELTTPSSQVTANVMEQRAIIKAKNTTRKYGEANPVFEYTIEGPAIEGKPEITCEATSTSPVGTYNITAKKGTINNTCVDFVAGMLTIEKAPLNIAADIYTKKQGESMPQFTLTYTGFKNQETNAVLSKQPIVSCEANKSSAPGEYTVTVSGAEAQNYDISYTNGKLVVIKGAKKGDVNSDDEVDVTDVVMIIDDILGKNPNGYNASVADVNNDGTIDVTDAVLIIDVILGKITMP